MGYFEQQKEEQMNRKRRNEYSNFNNTYDYLTNNFIATEKEIALVCSINGYNLESLNDILEVRTGSRNIEQLKMED